MWNSRPSPPFMEKTILNFHFDYLTSPLTSHDGCQKCTTLRCIVAVNPPPKRSPRRKNALSYGHYPNFGDPLAQIDFDPFFSYFPP